MKVFLRAIACVSTLTLMIACERGSASVPGLEGAGPLIAEFANAGKALQGLGSASAQNSGGQNAPSSHRDQLRKLGESAYAVLQSAEPTGSSGVEAIQEELAAAASDVVQHLVTIDGGTQHGPDNLISAPPQQVSFAVNVPARPLDTDRSERGKNTARVRLKADLSLEIEHFIYAALLANPAARAKFCGRCTQEDLPATVDSALNLPFDTTDEWRRLLFDEAGHLILPSPFSDRWVAFQGWTAAVNPALGDAARPLAQIAFDSLYL